MLCGMVPIPPHVFRQRLRRWHTQPDRRHVVTRDERGRQVEEWWSVGVCRLKRVRHRDGWELLADRGVPGTRINHPHGKIAFTYWDEP